jgi:hypothetical protein
MYTELRYQARIHAISNKPREKKILQILPKFYFILFLLKNQNNQKHAIWK